MVVYNEASFEEQASMVRFVWVASAIAALTLVLMPVQYLAVWLNLPLQRMVPVFYHRLVCALIGVRIRQIGTRKTDEPVLILSNHVSWLDISVISAAAPVVFVAKKEVGTWPIFGTLARLQRSVFVDRESRTKTGQTTGEIAGRLLKGDAVVLFAEGTSNDGNRVLPFRSSLVGAVHHALGRSSHRQSVTVQPLSIAYVGLGGLPMGRALRNHVAWYGDIDLLPHLKDVLAVGAIDVVLTWGEPVAYDVNVSRKEIAQRSENTVRKLTVAALRA